MKNTIEMMARLLEMNNIPIHEGTRKNDGGLGSHNESCHAFFDGSSNSYYFIIDLVASMHMASVKYFFSSMYSDSGPTV